MVTDWKQLATQLGSLEDDRSELGGDYYAKLALDEIFGDEWTEHAVEHIVSFKPGCELAMNCLRYFHSTKAANYAHKVYKSSAGERAARAVWLIKHLANPIALEWIEEFLRDENVMHWGIGVLDQLLWQEQIPYNDRTEYLMELAEKTSNGRLKVQVDVVREYLERRNKQ